VFLEQVLSLVRSLVDRLPWPFRRPCRPFRRASGRGRQTTLLPLACCDSSLHRCCCTASAAPAGAGSRRSLRNCFEVAPPVPVLGGYVTTECWAGGRQRSAERSTTSLVDGPGSPRGRARPAGESSTPAPGLAGRRRCVRCPVRQQHRDHTETTPAAHLTTRTTQAVACLSQVG